MSSQIQEILSYPFWRQSIKLSNEYSTPGRVNEELWHFLNLPNDLKGKSFLDVGANDGLFSFLAEKKGASKVVASDLYKDNVGSMELGWSYKGISMLKDYFQSGIHLHKGGIYHLNELSDAFDIVWVNNVINWLDDIEKAIENLASVTKGNLFISDGFITENQAADFIKPHGMPIRYMYKLSYMKKLLEKYGFTVEETTEINYEKIFMHYFISFPRLTVKKGTKIYLLPDENSEFKFSEKDITMYSFGRNGIYHHLFELGWIKESEAEVFYHHPSRIYKALKAIGLQSIYYFVKGKFAIRKKGYTSYVIKAQKN
jgi:SAM-dependent methyltransferase